MKLMLIEWDDACSGMTWGSRDLREHIDRIISVGILVREDEKEVEIIPNISYSHKLHQIAIPKGCIKRIRRLKIDG